MHLQQMANICFTQDINMKTTIIGLIILCLILIYFLVLSIRLFLIGQGLLEDIKNHRKQKNIKLKICAIFVFIPTFSFLVFLLIGIIKIVF